MSEPEATLREARELVTSDPERAKQLLLELAAAAPGHVWSDATVELAAIEFGYGDLDATERHAAAVLESADRNASPRAIAIAGVLLCEATNTRDGSCDVDLLRNSIDACRALGEYTYAGAGLRLLSYVAATRGDRADAKRSLHEAIDLYRRAQSLTGAASAVLRLGQLMIEDGEPDAARHLIDSMVKELEAEPLRGTSARILEKKLRQLL